MSNPFFSIVLPTYNRAHMIDATIASVVEQTDVDWELIVVDDGSTDDTGDVVRARGDERIRYLWQPNAERSAARNVGLNSAVGEFLCFIDSDDRWHVDHLAHIHAAIVAHDFEPALYFTAWNWLVPGRAKTMCLPSPDPNNLIEYVIENQIAPSAACMHRSIGRQVKFDPRLHINEDVEYFARVVSKFGLVRIRDASVDVIVHSGNTSGQHADCITPQIHAMEMVFANGDLAPRISRGFKRRIRRNLSHRLIEHHCTIGEYGSMVRELASFLVRYPVADGNTRRWQLLLRHLWRPRAWTRKPPRMPCPVETSSGESAQPGSWVSPAGEPTRS